MFQKFSLIPQLVVAAAVGFSTIPKAEAALAPSCAALFEETSVTRESNVLQKMQDSEMLNSDLLSFLVILGVQKMSAHPTVKGESDDLAEKARQAYLDYTSENLSTALQQVLKNSDQALAFNPPNSTADLTSQAILKKTPYISLRDMKSQIDSTSRLIRLADASRMSLGFMQTALVEAYKIVQSQDLNLANLASQYGIEINLSKAQRDDLVKNMTALAFPNNSFSARLFQMVFSKSASLYLPVATDILKYPNPSKLRQAFNDFRLNIASLRLKHFVNLLIEKAVQLEDEQAQKIIQDQLAQAEAERADQQRGIFAVATLGTRLLQIQQTDEASQLKERVSQFIENDVPLAKKSKALNRITKERFKLLVNEVQLRNQSNQKILADMELVARLYGPEQLIKLLKSSGLSYPVIIERSTYWELTERGLLTLEALIKAF